MVIAYSVTKLGTYGRKVIGGLLEYSRLHPEVKIWVRDCTLPSGNPETIDAVVTQWPIKDDQYLDGSIPVVNVSSTASPGIPQVFCDNDAIVRLVFEHFRERNFQSLAFIVSPQNSISSIRCDAFVAICREHGYYPIIIEADKKAFPKMDRQLVDQFHSLPKPVGLMVSDDQTGHLVLDLCDHIGIRVPGELAVVGVNNDVDLTLHDPLPLSSVDINAERIGYEAARLVANHLSGADTPLINVIDPLELTTRKSSDVMIVLDPNLGKALDFMHDHLGENIELEDILRQQMLSRRALEMHFRSQFNQSPMKHLRSLRIEKVKYLLETTDLKVKEIGKRCGLQDNNYLCRLFRTLENCSPSEYRKRHAQDRARLFT